MLNLLKTFGKGILYVIGLPFFLLALILFAAFGLLAFIFQLIKSIVFFFTGQKFFPELPEDRELRLMQEKANQPPVQDTPVEQTNNQVPPQFVPFPQPQDSVNEQPLDHEPTIEETVFNEPNYQQTTEPEDSEETAPLEDLVDDSEQEEDITEEETVLETSEEVEQEEEKEEELETYVPLSSKYDDQIDDDDDDGSEGGVNIGYDVR